MKKIITLLVTAVISISAVSVNAADIPRESLPCNATLESIAVSDTLISDILTDVQNGLGYADALNKANVRIFNAVVSGSSGGCGYYILAAIARNAIFQYRDMYLRPEIYTDNVPMVRELISDILSDYAAGTKDYTTAVKDAYIRIYQSVDPSFDPEAQFAIDTCYRDIPAVDSAMFTIARKLLLECTAE